MQHVKVLITAVVLAVLAICGCQTPYSGGLASNLSANGTSGTAIVEIAETPASLSLTGFVDLVEGTLDVAIIDPDGVRVVERSWTAIARESFSDWLEPRAGRWSIVVASPGGAGTYDIRLDY